MVAMWGVGVGGRLGCVPGGAMRVGGAWGAAIGWGRRRSAHVHQQHPSGPRPGSTVCPHPPPLSPSPQVYDKAPLSNPVLAAARKMATGVAVGMTATIFNAPFDVIKSRFQSQQRGPNQK